MDDMITRAAAIEAAIDGADDWDGGYNSERERHIREHMAKVPAVDAVPVIRCRDCCFGVLTKNSNDEDIVICENPDSPAVEQISIMPDWFCADGERRDDDGKDA